MEDLQARGARLLAMDVTDDGSVQSGVAQIIDEQGHIDVLFNNAGYGSYGAVECVPLEEIRHQYDVNVFGVARLIQAVLPHMRQKRQGRIINMASLVGRLSTPMLGWYASTKHAIEGMSDALRMEVRQFGIDVVVIEPGPVQTEFETVATASFERIDHPADYRAMATVFQKYNRELYAKAPGPAGTVNAVLAAIEARRPRRRYATTRLAKIAPFLRRWLGDGFFDWAMLNSLR